MFEASGSCEQRVCVRNIDGFKFRLHAEHFDLAAHVAQRRFVARDKADAVARAREAMGDSAPDAGARACYDHDASILA